MPETLCIAELKDGRRALCYIDADQGKAEIVLVLRPEDVERKPFTSARREAEHIQRMIREQRAPAITDAQPIPIPEPPKRRLTAADLLAMRGTQDEPTTREEQILRDLDRLERGDTEA